MHKLHYIDKVLSYLDSELSLTQLRIEYPEQFYQSDQPVLQSTLSVISKYPNLGIMGMTEILISLHLLGGIEDDKGKKPTKTALANAFEQAFGFTFNSLSDCQRELFKRKPYNLTKTLDALKAVLTKEYKRQKANQDSENQDAKR